MGDDVEIEKTFWSYEDSIKILPLRIICDFLNLVSLKRQPKLYETHGYQFKKKNYTSPPVFTTLDIYEFDYLRGILFKVARHFCEIFENFRMKSEFFVCLPSPKLS